MRKAEEIKKGLECCISDTYGCNEKCPYFNSLSNGVDCAVKMHADALAYIRQLESRVPRWIPVEERMPENDVPVLVSAKRKGWNGKWYSVVFTAFHTDGTTHTEDSGCDWNLEDTGLKYCEETDDYIIPEAWWEDVRYGEEFSKVYDTSVTHWMPLPEQPKEVQHK